MSLTAGSSPLGRNPAGALTPLSTGGMVYVEPYPRRVRGVLGGDTVVESDRTLLVHVPGHSPVYAFPTDDVRTGHGRPQPHAPGHVSIEWDEVEAWFEEDQQILGSHPRNPYHRIDCLPSSREVRVEFGGEILADTSDVVLVFETSLGPRAYVPRSQVRMDLLRPSDRTWFCPYKGSAVYFHARVGGTTVDDVAWSYEETYPEAAAIAGHLCFDDALVAVSGDLPQEWTVRV